jgi:manganese efflux pump family protein
MSYSHFIIFLITGIGLSFDSFAVSVSCGVMKQEIRFMQAVRIAFSLALFQTIFPVVGWMAGTSLQPLVQSIGHWLAFSLLALIGLKMIAEGSSKEGPLRNFNPLQMKMILWISVATSLDSMVVGFTFGFLDTPIILPVLIIGSVTFIASMLGMLCGKSIPGNRSHQSLILGGLILTGMGFKILAEHLWF